MDWNENLPDVVGLELVPQSSGTLPEVRIDSQVKAAAMRLKSTVTQTVNGQQLLLNADASGTIVLAEVFAAGTESPVVSTTICEPNALNADPTTSTPGTEADLLAILAQNPLDPTVHATGGSDPGEMAMGRLQFDIAGRFTGERIIDVRIITVMSDPANAGIQFRLSNVDNANTVPTQRYWHLEAVSDVLGPAIKTITVSTGEINPITSLPWTVADLELFDDSVSPTGQSFSVVFFNNLVSGPANMLVYQMYMEVDHCPENRKTVNLLTNFTGGSSGTGQRRKIYTPLQPDGVTTGYAKVNGTDLVLLLRQPRYGSIGADIGTGGISPVRGGSGLSPSALVTAMRFSVPYILALKGVPAVVDEYKDVSINDDGTVLSLGVSPGNRMLGWDMTIGGITSVDSQSFVRVNPQVIFAPLTQEIDLANGGYAGVLVPLAYTALTDVGDLTINLRRRSDDHLMATAVITQTMLAASPLDPLGNWRLVQAPFGAPATLAPGTQYYFEFIAGYDSVNNTGWLMPLLRAWDAFFIAAGGGATYRGETDVATSVVRRPDADLAIVAYMVPPAPTDMTVSPETAAVPINDVDCGASSTCDLTGIGYNHVSWNFTTTGGFSHYELQRQDDRTDWAVIAYITDQYVLDFDDLEARLGQRSCYRIRAFNHVGVASDWSDTNCGTAPVGGLGLTFTTNEEPETAVGYVDIANDATRGYQWDEASEDVERKLYGRDDVVVFKPLERRGPRFQRTMLIAAFVTQTNPGPDAFDALRDLAKAALSYVCVRDESGNRWFMSINVPEGFDRGVGDDGGDVYTATVRFVQVTSTPSQPDVVAIVS